MLRKSKLAKEVWDRISERIEGEVCDGIDSSGIYSSYVHYGQEKFIDGMRSARLAAVRVIQEIEDDQS